MDTRCSDYEITHAKYIGLYHHENVIVNIVCQMLRSFNLANVQVGPIPVYPVERFISHFIIQARSQHETDRRLSSHSFSYSSLKFLRNLWFLENLARLPGLPSSDFRLWRRACK